MEVKEEGEAQNKEQCGCDKSHHLSPTRGHVREGPAGHWLSYNDDDDDDMAATRAVQSGHRGVRQTTDAMSVRRSDLVHSLGQSPVRTMC